MNVHAYTRERVAELLGAAASSDLIELADACLGDGAELTVLTAPEVGTVAAQVREPIAYDRFFLGDVLACRAEVALGGARGWAVRMGDDRAATLAAAVCDAEVQAGRPHARAVLELCGRVERDRYEAELAEWDRLAPTIVQFEELT
ncbi:phosphonate C-P lyase system protein PhnG [Nocardia mexicana]|uniref:Alpha-D-ribose 1-methylphosphonate 5-triphosphate synthase subunit PhnG n=1 Tax=Nocardia mexicana TaxID=279262 RepID=A0A370HIQ4_9NOCA|nr:phosphonate C-P lyase system protein PhnG [Nocardia mexicana]RDI55349.1 alpha-D-ribose 1-methylphosphonate 5-triphosphate synthase subunit PhnG [Nocardia mexicana]